MSMSMSMMKLSDAAMMLNATLTGKDAEVQAVSTDSRSIAAGDLFVALRGENFDAHKFIAQVEAAGAVGAVVASDALDSLAGCALPLIAVHDTRLALGELAAAWRARHTLPVIAVTGSNGKTTTKEMIACILKAAFGDAVLATQGNLNNDIGVPLTLFRLRAEHKAAIIEMGMNHPGEIAYLTNIVHPDVALVTNAQRAHLQGMGSLDAVALEKGSIYDGLGANGIAVLNADDAAAPVWRQINVSRRVVDFGVDHPATIFGRVRIHGLENSISFTTPVGDGAVDLALPGVHNARNALAAVAATFAAGVPLAAIQSGLADFTGIKGRLQRRNGLNGAVILDDTYNANPDSVRAGLDVLASTIGRKILVLGDMGEIGDGAAQCHDEVGGYAKSSGVDALFALGEASTVAVRNFGEGAHHYKKIEDLIDAVKREMTTTTTVLVKGSRFMRMERVVDAISGGTAANVAALKENK